MDESAALAVVAVRAIETTDRDRALWSDADRAWASRAAAEVVGEGADAAAFVARRAGFALERLSGSGRAYARALAALRWRPWVGRALAVGAFAAGVAFDRVGGGGAINLLAPPVFALVAWNLAVYLMLALGYVLRYGDARPLGPVRELVARIAAWHRPSGADRDPVVACLLQLADDWRREAAPLYAARVARVLHVAAAALAAGVVAGLYLRGLAFEFRATWESTFLDAGTVRALLAALLAPGAFVTGIAVPSAAAVDAIRAPASENAATWLHLMAATVAAVVVLPRLLLALLAGAVEHHRGARLLQPLDGPYFARLLRGYRGGAVRVRAIPYSYTPGADAVAGLEAVVRRCFGGAATLTIDAPVGYGDEDAVVSRPATAGDGCVIGICSLAATPEQEVHAAFAGALRTVAGGTMPPLIFVDESPLVARWPDDGVRLAERRRLWAEALASVSVAPVFVRLSAPDLAAVEQAIEATWAPAGPPPAPGR